MRSQAPRYFLVVFVVAALFAMGFWAARAATFPVQNDARVGFLGAVVVAAIAFAWPGALISALAASALSFFAMRESLGSAASTRAPFLPALLLDVALFFGVGMLSALLVHDRRGLEEMAFRDEASGLLLWPRVLEQLGEEVRQARGDASPLALLLVEADDPAARSGEDATRRRELATLITQCARSEDIAGLGPPHGAAQNIGMGKAAIAPCFAVVLPRTSSTGAQALAERIVEAARRQTRLTGVPHSLSCGIALLAARAAPKVSDAATLVEHAEEALFEAQRTGQGRIVFFDAEMRAA